MERNNKLKMLISLLAVIILLVFVKQARHIQYVHSRSIDNSSSAMINNQNNSETNKVHIKLTATENNTCPQYIEYHGHKVIDWNKPTGSHPNLSNFDASQLLIKVNQSSQRLFIYNKTNNQLLTEFIISTGEKGFATPNGYFQIQQEHGKWFYNNASDIQEGAKNYVSFLHHGEYLFHSIPYNANQQPILSRMGKLGKKNSHGCIQMSLPDSEWFYNTFTQPNKIGTEVIISN